MKRTKEQHWKIGAGPLAMLVVLLPLWAEFQEPGQTLWNIALFLILFGLFVGTFFLQRYLRRNIDDVGEARFDTRNKP